VPPLKLRLLAATPVSALSCLLAASSAGDVHADGLLAPIWTGAYAGIHGGANWLDVDTSDGLRTEATNAVFGVHVGLNLGLGLAVVGVEADLNYEDSSLGFTTNQQGVTGQAEIDATGTIRGRLGLPIGPALIYATAGYAWADVGATLSGPGLTDANRSDGFHGIVYGGGVEAYVLPKTLIRVEALQFDYSTDNFSFGPLGSSSVEFNPSATVVRAGISFRFN
jgi:outer membrane immunogenic protein